MPRCSDNLAQKQFVMIDIDLLQALQNANASGLCTRVLIALKSFAWDGKSCFPSIKTIAERMKYPLDKGYARTIGRALKWLEDNGFIQRHSKRSKHRFVMMPPPKDENLIGLDCPTRVQKNRTNQSSEQDELNLNILNTPKPPSDKSDRGSTNTGKISSPKAAKKPSKRKPRMSIEERRVRRHQRRQEANEEQYRAYQEQQRKEAAAREEELIRQITEMKQNTMNLTDRMISLIGSRKIKDQYVLLLGRWHWERTGGDCWHYEPPTKEQIAADLNAVLEYARSSEAYKTDYHLFYAYASQQQFWNWLKK